MNQKFFVSSLFISLLVPFATGQTSAPSSLESDSQVVVARCRYSPMDSICVEEDRTSPPPEQTSGVKTDQCHHPRPWPPRRGYPQAPTRPSYPPFVFQTEYGTHAAAGAAIGFLAGAAAAASAQTDGRSRFVAGVFGGGFGALIGAVIGHGIPSSHWAHHHYPVPDDGDDDDEMAVARSPKKPDLKEP